MKFKVREWVRVKKNTDLQGFIERNFGSRIEFFQIANVVEKPNDFDYELYYTHENFYCNEDEIEPAPYCNTELWKALNGELDEV